METTSKPKILIAGGNGFLGKFVSKKLLSSGYDVRIISHKKDPGIAVPYIVADISVEGSWMDELEGSDAVINLCGHPVRGKLNGDRLNKVYTSRIGTTKMICRAIAQCDTPPILWINISSVFAYGDNGNKTLTEDSKCAPGFLSGLCAEWEGACYQTPCPATRIVVARSGIAAARAGLFDMLYRAASTRLFAGFSDIDPYISWISPADLGRIMQYTIEHQEVSGIVNCCSPHPVTLSQIIKEFQKSEKGIHGIKFPSASLTLLAGLLNFDKRLMTDSRRIIPHKLMQYDFKFLHPDLYAADII
jgi:uncharacterized protein (TIGR01777 family)